MIMKTFFWFCLVFFTLAAGFILITQRLQSSYYRGSLSDHFNGTVFFNAGPYHLHTFKDMLKWDWQRQRTAWPAWVNNTGQNEISPPKGSEIKVTFINHATVLIQTPPISILTDPIWSRRASPYQWIGPKRVRDPGVAFANLPPIDVVLISHNHYDHLDIPTLQKLNAAFHPLFLVPLGNKMLLARYGITHVVEMDWWQTQEIKNASITFLPTQHWSARGITDKCKTLWGSYGISVANKHIYFAGDTGYSSHFKTIQQKWGTPDLAFLPIGAYLPEWFMQLNHLNPKEAVQAHLDLKSKHSIGIHFGTFQLSDEGIDQPKRDLEDALKSQGIEPTEFHVLPEGETRVC